MVTWIKRYVSQHDWNMCLNHDNLLWGPLWSFKEWNNLHFDMDMWVLHLNSDFWFFAIPTHAHHVPCLDTIFVGDWCFVPKTWTERNPRIILWFELLSSAQMNCRWQVYLMIIWGQYVGEVLCGPSGVVTLLTSQARSTFEWCVARLVFMKGHQKDTCNDDEIGIFALNICQALD